ncbi:MAG TPA: methylenetetrahydrofolate--tRNA-(uracil(54)-C(5))-methyltransferase (FADH(2)-oxidizing) TrmFO [Chitinispirillaceae bacterium]|nr:methylenetetrahydrofolate--tRNA-(uracil(54)-C(5))-methyltransferase (FADH(2)-oxidizing) TrmFO [Chitinispirillaceae bacterium]
MAMNSTVAIIGAGLAGSEAALVLSRNGISVELYEARPEWSSPAHKTSLPAELVCSNSLKADQLPSAHGLLKAELSLLNSPLIMAARRNSVPAGSALAVDRELFSRDVQSLLLGNQGIKYICKEMDCAPADRQYCIIAAGPLASDKLTFWLKNRFPSDTLHFYDAIAPIVQTDSIDFSIAFRASRWEDGEGDYINCPFTEDEYRNFYEALRDADRVNAREFESEKFFEACLPVEISALRGFDALAYGPMRPVGLIDPRSGRRPYAVCQLRKENASGSSYNLVGFQTRLTIPEQQNVFRLIPGLGNAEFLRYGSIHRNTYFDSPRLLSYDLSFREERNLFLAGQICGNEGYTESIATGHLAALFVISRIKGTTIENLPLNTATGALLNHVLSSEIQPFTPSNVHFGLFPAFEHPTRKRIGKKEKKELICETALQAFEKWKQGLMTNSGISIQG